VEWDVASVIEGIATGIEVVGVAILVVAGIVAAVAAVGDLRAGRDAYTGARQRLGRGLLLGLEVLVAADIIQTVAVEFSLTNVATLGLLVLIRTILSVSITAELDGVVPWRKAALERSSPRVDGTGPA
jgi:uncharacterized membrane protein